MLESYDVMRICGVRLGRVWGYLREIQREENWFDRSQMDLCLKELKKRRIEPVFCLAGGAGMTFRDAGPNPEVSDYPPFLHRYLKPKTNRKGILYLDWPLDQWEKHVRNCLKSWGDTVQIWELFNEPDQNTMDASHYQKYLESTWRTLKKENPKSLLLGNGNTCDVGFEKSWCARLNQANPDYVNWMDGVAFHPYWNSTDCIGGIYNLYTRHIQELRGKTESAETALEYRVLLYSERAASAGGFLSEQCRVRRERSSAPLPGRTAERSGGSSESGSGIAGGIPRRSQPSSGTERGGGSR